MPPTVVLSDVPTDIQNGAFDITITFSEAVLNFVAGDISLGGTATATVSNLGAGSLNASDAEEYVATITPTGSGTLTIQVPADVAEDAAANGNTASTIASVELDLVRPTVSISDVPTTPQNAAFDITITFSEAVSNFVVGDIDLTGPATLDLTGTGDTYTATITPNTGADADVAIQVPADVAEDAATNGNTASTVSTVPVDLVPPTVALSNVPTDVQNGAFDITITFSEDVSDFVAGDIDLTGPATLDLTGTGNIYTATITPEAEAIADITIQVPANVAEDAATNGNTASTNETVSVNLVRPVAEITGQPKETPGGAFLITVTFSEPVTGFTFEDVALTGSVPAEVLVAGSGAVYTGTITPTSTLAGDIRVQILDDAAEDAFGNGNVASETFEIEIWMPDKSLRDVVRSALGLDEYLIFTQEALLALALLNIAELPLDLADAKITNLTGLASSTELIELYLDENEISDISPIAALTQLRVLSLNDNQIEGLWHADSDVNPFTELTELTELYLDNNLISDLSPLEALPQLTKLSLDRNNIDDVSALEALTALTRLSLNENSIEDITALAGLTELTELTLNENSIEDISPLALLTRLEILHLENNEISDVSPLADLLNLKDVKLVGNPIDGTAPLIGIARHIETDEPIGALVSDAALAEVLRETFDLDTDEHITYADMRNLTELEGPDSGITDLKGLEHAPKLQRLDLRGNGIADVKPLKVLKKLRHLDLGVNSITDISALAELDELTELYLGENSIADITPLVGLVSLEILRLADNPIADARPLAMLTDVDIDIDVTRYLVEIPDPGLAAALRDALELDPEAGIPSTELLALTTLDASDRQISNLSGLEIAAALTELDLRDNAITDVAPLATLVNLKTLRLTGNPFTDASPLADLTADIEADIVVPGVIADPNLAAAIRDRLGLPADTRIIASTLEDFKTS